MDSPTPRSPRTRSQVGGRRSSRPPSHLHSDCPPEPPDDPADSPSLGKRSVSLTTLQPSLNQPRMAQLETLEAKMASIEVSLSSTPRRKKNGLVNGFSLGSSIRSIPKEIASKELESLRHALRDKENIIQSLKGQLTIPGLRLTSMRSNSSINNNNNNGSQLNRELSEVEKKQAEERLQRLKIDTDNKRLTIKNLKMALERLDITDNIDVRIQQAELEYQLGREELNLLTLLEETRALQLCLEESNKCSSDPHTLYSCVKDNENITLLAVEVVYDPKSPKFVVGSKDSTQGLWIHWALEETHLKKGDRLLEVNGKMVLTKTREDLTRLLSAAPDPAQIVVLRHQPVDSNASILSSKKTAGEVAALRGELEVVKERADEAQRAKDGLRADNVRLTHRISYLEEQVSELLSRKSDQSDCETKKHINTTTTKSNVTSISITTKPSVSVPTNGSNDVQVFQKGPQVTALVANLPGLEPTKEPHTSLPVRSKSSMSNVSSTHIPVQSNESHHCHRQKQKQKPVQHNHAKYYDQIPDNRTSYKKYLYHNHVREVDYNSETNSNSEHVQNKRNVENGYNGLSKHHVKTHSENGDSSLMDQSYKRATKIVHDLTRYRDNSLYEKHRQKCISASEKYNGDLLKHYNVRKSTSVLDFQSEVHIRPNKYADSKSVEELDAIESKPEKKVYAKRIPDSRSVKSLDFDSDSNSLSYPINPNPKVIDYASEPDNNKKMYTYGDNMKPRPTPPKKPLRLSLHKAQSLQSVEASVQNGVKHEVRKSLKRSHKGDVHQNSVTVRIESQQTNGSSYSSEKPMVRSGKDGTLQWTNFSQMK